MSPGTTNEFTQPLMGFGQLRIDRSRQQGIRERAESPICSCCESPMAVVEDKRVRDVNGTHTLYSACAACGFFRRRVDSGLSNGDYLIPSVREFDPESETPSLSHLTGEIAKHPDRLYKMEPYRFEHFVGSVFRDYFDCEVYHVGQSGDDGVDLFAIVKDEPFLIQVKRRTKSTATEGVEVVKLLFASAFGQGGNQGAVVTTAKKFSRAARSWAKTPRLADISFKIQLLDFASLMSMVNCVASKGDPPPWVAFKESDGPAPFFSSEEGWTIVNHDEHDVLVRNEDSKTTALIFDHRALEDCVVLSGVSETVVSAVEKWRARELTEAAAEEMGIRMSLRRNDNMLGYHMAVPFRLGQELFLRWLALYPERVFDAEL